jgi:hypothetical protein
LKHVGARDTEKAVTCSDQVYGGFESHSPQLPEEAAKYTSLKDGGGNAKIQGVDTLKQMEGLHANQHVTTRL